MFACVVGYARTFPRVLGYVRVSSYSIGYARKFVSSEVVRVLGYARAFKATHACSQGFWCTLARPHVLQHFNYRVLFKVQQHILTETYEGQSISNDSCLILIRLGSFDNKYQCLLLI